MAQITLDYRHAVFRYEPEDASPPMQVRCLHSINKLGVN
jgi:hypothetical protein